MTGSSYSRSTVEQICNKAQLLLAQIKLLSCFQTKSFKISAGVSVDSSDQNIWADRDQCREWAEQRIAWAILSAVFHQLAGPWPIKTPSSSSVTPACLWTPSSWQVYKDTNHSPENSPRQSPSREEYPIPHSGLGLQRCCPTIPTRPQTYPGILNSV